MKNKATSQWVTAVVMMSETVILMLQQPCGHLVKCLKVMLTYMSYYQDGQILIFPTYFDTRGLSLRFIVNFRIDTIHMIL